MRSGDAVVMGNRHVNGATTRVTETPRRPGRPLIRGLPALTSVRIASVRAAEPAIEILLHLIRGDRRQQAPDGGQVLLSKHRELGDQLRRSADTREVLLATRKSQPVVAGKR